MVPEPQVQVQEASEREGDGRAESTQPGKKTKSFLRLVNTMFFLTRNNAVILLLFLRRCDFFFLREILGGCSGVFKRDAIFNGLIGLWFPLQYDQPFRIIKAY